MHVASNPHAVRDQEEGRGAPAAIAPPRLTPTQIKVMRCVHSGLLNKQIAAQLNLSEVTVKVRRGQVMRKMAALSLADLVRYAERIHGTEQDVLELRRSDSP